jgi:hypothetical protein
MHTIRTCDTRRQRVEMRTKQHAQSSTPWGKQSPARFFAAGCSLLRRKPCGKGLGAGRLAGVVGEARGGQLGHHGRGWRTLGPRRSPAGGTTTHGLLPMWLNAARDHMTHWVLDFSPCDVARWGEMAKPQRVGARWRATNGGCEAAGASCVRRRPVAARRGGADAVGKVLGVGLRRAGVVAGEPSHHGCSVNVLRIRGAISTLGAEGTHVVGRPFWKMHRNAWKRPRDGLAPRPAGQWATRARMRAAEAGAGRAIGWVAQGRSVSERGPRVGTLGCEGCAAGPNDQGIAGPRAEHWCGMGRETWGTGAGPQARWVG